MVINEIFHLQFKMSATIKITEPNVGAYCNILKFESRGDVRNILNTCSLMGSNTDSAQLYVFWLYSCVGFSLYCTVLALYFPFTSVMNLEETILH